MQGPLRLQVLAAQHVVPGPHQRGLGQVVDLGGDFVAVGVEPQEQGARRGVLAQRAVDGDDFVEITARAVAAPHMVSRGLALGAQLVQRRRILPPQCHPRAQRRGQAQAVQVLGVIEGVLMEPDPLGQRIGVAPGRGIGLGLGQDRQGVGLGRRRPVRPRQRHQAEAEHRQQCAAGCVPRRCLATGCLRPGHGAKHKSGGGAPRRRRSRYLPAFSLATR